MLERAVLTAFVATAHSERSKNFYERVLGLKLVSDEEFAIVFDCGGTQLRIQKVEQLAAQPFTALGWQVDDIRAAMQELGKRGVEFEW